MYIVGILFYSKYDGTPFFIYNAWGFKLTWSALRIKVTLSPQRTSEL